MEFYKSIFGGKLELNTYKEFGQSQDPSQDDLIMHAMLEADNGITFMAADALPDAEYKLGNNMSMCLSGDNKLELQDYWDKLSAGATIKLPLEAAVWGDLFGMLTDQYGIDWMVNINSHPS